MVEHAEAPCDPVEHRHLLRRVAGHDLCIFLVGRLTADLCGEGADVVGDETVHARHRPGLGRVPRCGDLLGDLEAVVLVKDVEQLGVGMEVLLARVRVRGIHVRSDRVRDRLALGTLLGPPGDRVAQTLTDDTLEGLTILWAIQMAQKIVERPVLEQDENNMVHRMTSINRHRDPSWRLRTLRCGPTAGKARPTDVNRLRSEPRHSIGMREVTPCDAESRRALRFTSPGLPLVDCPEPFISRLATLPRVSEMRASRYQANQTTGANGVRASVEEAG